MAKGIRRAILVFVVTAVTALTWGVGPAAAATWVYRVADHATFMGYGGCQAKMIGWKSQGNAWGMGCFQAEGDEIYVYDYEKDGLSVGVHFKVYAADGSLYKHGICRHKGGGVEDSATDPQSNSGGNRSVCQDGAMNFVEDRRIIIQVGRCDGDVRDCSKWSNYTNKTAWDGART